MQPLIISDPSEAEILSIPRLLAKGSIFLVETPFIKTFCTRLIRAVSVLFLSVTKKDK